MIRSLKAADRFAKQSNFDLLHDDVPQIDATFITVKYANKKILVNTDCAIRHLMLFLSEKYIEEGGNISSDTCIVPSNVERVRSPTKGSRLKLSLIVCLDLLDDGAMPAEVCNRDPSLKVRNFVHDRGVYMLSQVKRTSGGIIKEALPLVLNTPVEYTRRIDNVLRSIERVKRRGGIRTPDRISPSKSGSDPRKKDGSRINEGGNKPRTFASIAKALR